MFGLDLELSKIFLKHTLRVESPVLFVFKVGTLYSSFYLPIFRTDTYSVVPGHSPPSPVFSVSIAAVSLPPLK